MQNYAINTGAPQTQRVYDWQEKNKEWIINKIYCGNCGARLKLEKFCPRCGFMIVKTQNPQPPKKD